MTGLTELDCLSVRGNRHAAPPGEKCTRTGEGVHPATTLMRNPDGKSQRGDDGGKGIGSSGNDEETEDGSTMCTGDEVERRQGTEDGGGIQDAARRRRR